MGVMQTTTYMLYLKLAPYVANLGPMSINRSYDSIAWVGYVTLFSLCSVTILSSNTDILFSVGLV